MNTKLSTWSLLGSLTPVSPIGPVQDLSFWVLSFSFDCEEVNGVEEVLVADEEVGVKGLSEGLVDFEVFSVKGGGGDSENDKVFGSADVVKW